MKKNFFFLTFFLLIGCTSNTSTTTKISCPDVFFATEHTKYVDSNTQPISIDNLSYSANINNYAFNSDCLIIDDIIQAELSLLFIVKPYQAKESALSLPFYVAILDERNELVDMQYYQVEGNLKNDPETKKYIETELTNSIIVQMPLLVDQGNSRNILVVGFMLDKKKLEILN